MIICHNSALQWTSLFTASSRSTGSQDSLALKLPISFIRTVRWLSILTNSVRLGAVESDNFWNFPTQLCGIECVSEYLNILCLPSPFGNLVLIPSSSVAAQYNYKQFCLSERLEHWQCELVLLKHNQTYSVTKT